MLDLFERKTIIPKGARKVSFESPDDVPPAKAVDPFAARALKIARAEAKARADFKRARKLDLQKARTDLAARRRELLAATSDVEARSEALRAAKDRFARATFEFTAANELFDKLKAGDT